MATKTTFDVVIVGGGIVGLAARRHLARLGIKNVALASTSRYGPAQDTARISGIISGGQVDNFTRISHSHGAEFAAAFWRFGDAAFDELEDFCREHKVPISAGPRLRLITSPQELNEARQAVRLMQAAGLSAQLYEPAGAHPLGSALSERVLAIQDEGLRAATLDVSALFTQLHRYTNPVAKPSAAKNLPPVKHVESSHSGSTITLMDGTIVNAELVIIAAHLATGDLLPTLKNALVSVADQWSLVQAERDYNGGCSAPHASTLGLWKAPGIVFSANHTYEWGATLERGRFIVGGGRYLRPMAGIEAVTAPADDKITKHLLAQFAKTFTFGQAAQATASYGFLDCRPCDELPVIGPLYGNGRILVATGFMGGGLSMGYRAGRCLAELIAHGASHDLLRELWPERLRSLES